MAQCKVYHGLGPCVVGLLGLTSSSNIIKDSLQLWLIDATGAYCVQAYTIGRDGEIINSCLLKIDFSNLSSKGRLDYIHNIILSHYINTSQNMEATK